MSIAKATAFVAAKPFVAVRPKAQVPKRAAPVAAYGKEGEYFDLSDLENTVGSWDMYGQDDNKQRYNGLQSEFFERAAGGLTRREYLNALIALGGGAGILVWGALGSSKVQLPITQGPKKGGEPGARGKI